MIELRFTVLAPKRIEPVQLFLCLLGLPERIGGVFVVVTDAHVDASGSEFLQIANVGKATMPYGELRFQCR